MKMTKFFSLIWILCVCASQSFCAILEKAANIKGVHIGCFDAWNNNTLQYRSSIFIELNTLEACSSNCRQGDDEPNAFILLKGKYCTCIDWNQFSNTRVDDNQCKVKCPGDERSTCGGHHTFSVYCRGSDETDCSEFQGHNPASNPWIEEVVEDMTIKSAGTEIAYTCVNCTAGLPSCIQSAINPSYDYIPGNTPRLCAEYCGRPVKYYNSGREVTREPKLYAFTGWDTRVSTSGPIEISICKCSNTVLDRFEEVGSEVCTKRCPELNGNFCGAPGKGVFSVYHSRP